METLQNEQRETCYTQVDYVASKMVTIKTFWTGVFACSLLSVCWGGAWVYYLGPSIGVVGVEGESYSRLAEINSRLNAENERGSQEIARLNNEIRKHATSGCSGKTKCIAMRGFVLDSANKLDLATRINKFRPEGFPFKDWHPSFAEEAINLCLRAGHNEALKWVTEQPNWFTIISEETALEVRTAVEANRSLLADKL